MVSPKQEKVILLYGHYDRNFFTKVAVIRIFTIKKNLISCFYDLV